MSVTFGSIGDIIAVSLLVKDLISSLDDSRGSSAEFQDVIRELHSLDRALLQIEQLARKYNNTPELTTLFMTAQSGVSECQKIIGDFLNKVDKYRRSLGQGSTSDALSKAARKVQWVVAQKKELANFRARVATHTESLTMLMATASINVLALCEENVRSQMRSDTASMNDILNKQNNTLLNIDSQIAENRQLTSSTNAAVKGLVGALRLNWLRDFTSSINAMVQKVLFVNIATYRVVHSIQQNLPSAAERSMALFQEPVVLEDAIGRVTPVHLQFITSWSMFDSVMAQRFENAPGFDKVLNKQYILQDRASRREISRSRPFDVSFLPGQRVDMSLIFRMPVGARSYPPSCPRCLYCPDDAKSDIDTECDNCGMIYCRVTAITNTRHSQDYQAEDLSSLFTIAPTTHNVSHKPSITTDTKKRAQSEADLDELDSCAFKRVRIAPYIVKAILDNVYHQWWLPRDGIDPDVIQQTINCYCGPQASVREGFGVGMNKRKPGYWINAYRGLTPAMIEDVKQYSRDVAARDHLQELEEAE